MAPERRSLLGRILRIALPIVVLGAGFFATWALVTTADKLETRRPERSLPVVRTLVVKKGVLQLWVTSEGTVRPETETVLVPEVSGMVTEVSPAWADGGFFRAGDMLLQIDLRDYHLALVRADAEVARAKLALVREEEEGAVARKEWESLGRIGEPASLVLREPQLTEARAAVAAAEASQKRAALDLRRTAILAPYDGRMRQKSVDIGQYVSRGSQVARIYSVEKAEVRLPIPDRELAYMELPLDYQGETHRTVGPEVHLSARFARREFAWTGRIVRTEGEIDAESRRVHAVAEIEGPYTRGDDDPERPPLAVGLFVTARIRGRTLDGVVALPRHALRDGHRVLIVDSDSRLRFRQVEIVRTQGDEVIVGSGVEDGEVVCITSLEVVVDGMQVKAQTD